MAASTANELTRQQLEELDALLQRMLAAPTPTPEPRRPVPPTPSIPAVPPIVESWRVDRADLLPPRLHLEIPERPVAPAPRADFVKPTFVPAEPPIPPTAPVPSIAEEMPEETLGVPVTPSMPYRPESPVVRTEPVPMLQQRSETPPERPEPIPVLIPEPIPLQSIQPASPEASVPGIPVALWPVYAINWIAEEVLVALGCEAMTRPAAKWALGLTGLAMMLVAAACVLTGGQLTAMFR